jgi:hypothetical protein
MCGCQDFAGKPYLIHRLDGCGLGKNRVNTIRKGLEPHICEKNSGRKHERQVESA